MCGIAGEYRLSSQASQIDWREVSEQMYRRGPDDDGYWEHDQITLVFRRLAILDLNPTGHQPMMSQDQAYVITFNGELYNYKELRKELQQKGINFRSSGDTEVVLHSLIVWGLDALSRFNGMFALAFYDRERKELLIARDHAGIKPLYYSQQSDGFIFASQYDQILAHPQVRRNPPSQAALALYLRLGFIPAPYAALESTHMLEPGSWICINNTGNLRKGRYFEFSRAPKQVLSKSDAFEAVDSAISAAVKRQMVCDVPLGAFLSGGIDSPLVVAKMAQSGRENIHTFTIASSDPDKDESSDAKKYAELLGVKQTIRQISPGDALTMIDDVLTACSEPFADYSIFPTLLVSRLAREEFTVMLSGDGGDELFWGYPGRQTPLLRNAHDFAHSPGIRKLMWLTRKFRGHKDPQGHLKNHATLGDWQIHCHRFTNERLLNDIFYRPPQIPSSFTDYSFNEHNQDSTAYWLRWNEFSNHMTRVLLKVDRASMHNSLEVRVPLLDMEVIRASEQIAWQDCIELDSELGKLPLRHSLKKHASFQTHAKKGFEMPMGSWLSTSLSELIHETLLQRKELMGIKINSNALTAMYNRHRAGHADYTQTLWLLLSLALWEKKYLNHQAIV